MTYNYSAQSIRQAAKDQAALRAFAEHCLDVMQAARADDTSDTREALRVHAGVSLS